MASRNGSKEYIFVLVGFIPTLYIMSRLNFTFGIIEKLAENYISNIDWDKIDYKTELKKLNKAKVAADDRLLVEIIRRYYIEPPSDDDYGLQYPEIRDPSQGQAAVVDKTLHNKEGGFYIECGAHDGEFISNTLFFERHRNWSGILIEANPKMFQKLKQKHRKAFTMNACVSLNPYPSEVTFGKESVLDGDAANFTKDDSTVVQCFPLYSILLALDRLQVDYFSLDVEGHERAILGTIPWDKLDIRMFSIEYNLWEGGGRDLQTYMRRKGYKYVTEVNEHYAADIMFLKEK